MDTTALHIAVGANHTDFMKNWLELMSEDDVEKETNYGFTALHFAAQVGNVSMAEQLVKKNRALPLIVDRNGNTPLIIAAYVGHKNMVSYLFSGVSTPPQQLSTPEKRIKLLHLTIRNDLYGKPYI